MRINEKYYNVVFAIFVSLGMSIFMSLALAIVNVGIPPNFLNIWLIGFAVSFLVSIPISLILVPIIKKTVDKLTGQQDNRTVPQE